MPFLRNLSGKMPSAGTEVEQCTSARSIHPTPPWDETLSIRAAENVHQVLTASVVNEERDASQGGHALVRKFVVHLLGNSIALAVTTTNKDVIRRASTAKACALKAA